MTYWIKIVYRCDGLNKKKTKMLEQSLEMSNNPKEFKKVSFYLHLEQYKSLKAYCLEQDISFGRFLMIACKRYFGVLKTEAKLQLMSEIQLKQRTYHFKKKQQTQITH